MNKRGQIAMLMIFVVAIILVIVTLVSFSNFGGQFGVNSLLVNNAMSKVDFGENYDSTVAKLMAQQAIKSNSATKAEFQRLAVERAKLGVTEAGTFFRIIGEGYFDFSSAGANYLLKIGNSTVENEKLFVERGDGCNHIGRYFVICMLFDSKGDYILETIDPIAYKASCG